MKLIVAAAILASLVKGQAIPPGTPDCIITCATPLVTSPDIIAACGPPLSDVPCLCNNAGFANSLLSCAAR
jgi:hypothetical protein